jgi:hypothetical protein
MKMLYLVFVFILVTPIMSAPSEGLRVEISEEARTRRGLVMVGGYRPCPDLQNPRLLAVAEFAASQPLPEKYSFAALSDPTLSSVSVRVVRADQQVVAGMNYRMLLLLVKKEPDAEAEKSVEQGSVASCVGAFSVTVYDHFGTLDVTSWGDEVECGKAKALLENELEFFERAPSNAEKNAPDDNP